MVRTWAAVASFQWSCLWDVPSHRQSRRCVAVLHSLLGRKSGFRTFCYSDRPLLCLLKARRTSVSRETAGLSCSLSGFGCSQLRYLEEPLRLVSAGCHQQLEQAWESGMFPRTLGLQLEPRKIQELILTRAGKVERIRLESQLFLCFARCMACVLASDLQIQYKSRYCDVPPTTAELG